LRLMLLLRIISIEKCKTNGKFCPQWKALPFFALYLALHRGTGVHSLIIDPLVDHLAVLFSQLHVTRFYVTLVLCALIFLFFYTRLFLSLPKRTKLLLIITAVLFLLGVRKLGFALNSLEEVNYLIVETISKWLEMSGTVLLLYAFLDYLETEFSKVEFKILDKKNTDLVESRDKDIKDEIPAITIIPRRIVHALSAIALSLWLISLGAQLIRYLAGFENGLGLIPIMDVGRESSIPTIFSVLLLYFAAMILGGISVFKHQIKDAFRRDWSLLSLGFLFMSLDEGSSIHELLTMPVWNLLGAGAPGFFRFAWVLPAAVVVLMVGVVLYKFIRVLDKKTRTRFIISGLVFLSGAVGVEMIGGNYAHIHGIWNLPYSMLAAVEELLEMAGAILFLYALLDYSRSNFPEFAIRFES